MRVRVRESERKRERKRERETHTQREREREAYTGEGAVPVIQTSRRAEGVVIIIPACLVHPIILSHIVCASLLTSD